MDDILALACPGCARPVLFEAARRFELDHGRAAVEDLLCEIGVLSETDALRAREATQGVEIDDADERTGFVGVVRALGLLRKSLYVAVAEPEAGEAGSCALRLAPLVDLVGESELEEAMECELRTNERSGFALAKLVLSSQKDLLLQVLEDQEEVDVDALELEPSVVAAVPPGVAASHLVIPLRFEDDRLVVAARDPLDYDLVDKLKFVVGREIVAERASEDGLLRALERWYSPQDLVAGDEPERHLLGSELALLEASPDGEPSVEDLEAAGIPAEPQGARSLELLLAQAVRDQAEQVVVEPLEVNYRVRFRMGGALRDVSLLTNDIGQAVVEQALVRARLDRTAPGHGGFELRLLAQPFDVAVGYLPAVSGGVLTMRVRTSAFSPIPFQCLALMPQQAQVLRRVLHASPGLSLVVSPESQGRSTMLYALFGETNRVEEQALVFERSVKVRVPGVSQYRYTDLESVLPVVHELGADRIFIDDLLAGGGDDCALGSVRAVLDLALCGHSVVATVRADSALQAVARLAACGANLATLRLVLRKLIFTTLVGRVCPACRREVKVSRDSAGAGGTTVDSEPETAFVGTGCWECRSSGYVGSGALVELLPVARHVGLQDALVKLDARRLERAAHEADVPLLSQHARRALRQGLTSLAQVRHLL